MAKVILGMSRSDAHAIRDAEIAKGLPDPLTTYTQHRNNAKRRGIGFELSFADWWAIWASCYHNRGRNYGQFVMARFGDQGAYAVGNVEIKTNTANIKEHHGLDEDEVARADRTFGVACYKHAHRRVAVGVNERSGDIQEDFDEDEEESWGPKTNWTSSYSSWI